MYNKGKGNNNKIRDFEIYNLSIEFAIDIYKITKDFPSGEKYGLISQLRRAAISVGANISEGYGRYHYKDQTHFDYQARGSLFECLFLIEIARKIRIVKQKRYLIIRSQINKLGAKINAYIRYLKERNEKDN